MRKLVVSMNLTLNGFVAGPDGSLDWHFPFWNDEMSDAWCRRLVTADTLLLGRNTYQAMAQTWSSGIFSQHASRSDLVMADMMFRYKKLVYSKQPMDDHWNNAQTVHGDLADSIAHLKKLPGRDIVVYGSCRLVAALMELELIDQYDLWIHPVMIPAGRSLFTRGFNATLADMEFLRNGVVKLCFAQAGVPVNDYPGVHTPAAAPGLSILQSSPDL